jgi:hypothetical protein
MRRGKVLRFLAGGSLTRWFVVRRSVRLVIAAVLLVVSARFAPQLHSAQTDSITVCASECDHKTIQEAIDAPSTDAGDTIQILDAIHTEAGIVVTKSVNIVGTGMSGTVVQAEMTVSLAGNRVFRIEGGTTVTIQGMKIRYGRAAGSPAQGGGILNNGSLRLERVAVTDNLAVGSDGNPGGTAEGGGIYNNGSLILVRSVIGNNDAKAGDGSSNGADGGDGHGGGIANGTGGLLTVINSTISGNAARGGYGFG